MKMGAGMTDFWIPATRFHGNDRKCFTLTLPSPLKGEGYG